MHGETRKYEGMRRTYWYAAMTEDAVQRSIWTFYEVVKAAREKDKKDLGLYEALNHEDLVCLLKFRSF